MKSYQHISWQRVTITIIGIFLLVLLYIYFQDTIFNLSSDEFYQWTDTLGIWAPLIMIILMAVEVVVAPLPGGWLAIATGYLFGPWIGFLTAYCGMVLGSLLAFEISRRLGQPYVRKVVAPEKHKKYSEKIHASRWGILLLYAIPLFPVDIVSLLLGLTTMTRKRFVLLMGIGFIPNMFALNFIGSAIAAPEYQIMLIVLSVAVILYFIFSWMRHRPIKHSN